MRNGKGKKKILIVDDEKDILKIVGKRLNNAGYEVLSASGGKEAFAILEKEIPDLILLDIVMPDIDGIEVFSKIKKNRYMSGVPIIFFTVRDSVNDKIKGLKRGVYDYITKPIDHRELLTRIEAVLKINEHYREISLRDELTGLYNFNFFEKQFAHIFDLSKRYKRLFSLIIIDIDNFKKINDNYGHLCGNFVLKKVGEILVNNLRKADIIARYGGDEFVVILPETNHEQAIVVMEKLKRLIKKIELNYKGIKIEARISFGLSTYSENIKTKESLFNIADKDMYKDKINEGDLILRQTR